MSGAALSVEVTTDGGQTGFSLPDSVRVSLHVGNRSQLVGLLEEIQASAPGVELVPGAYDTTAWVAVKDEEGATIMTVYAPDDLIPPVARTTRTEQTQAALDAVMAEVMS